MSYNTYFNDIPGYLSVEEKAKLIRENAFIATRLRNEINAFKISSTAPMESETETITTSSSTSLNKGNQVGSHIQKAYHTLGLLPITGLSEEAITTKIKGIIDANKLSALEIDKVKLLLYQDYLLYSKMYLESHPTEQHEIENQIASLMAKIYILDDLAEEEDLSEEEIAASEAITSNNLFFLLTENGNNPILESIRKKKIPMESYYKVKEILLDIKRGSIRNAKSFRSFSFYEIRNDDIRVVFGKLNNGSYIIIDVILKTFQNNNYYVNHFTQKDKQYIREKPFYIAGAEDEEFRKRHERDLAELLAILESKGLSEVMENARRNM